MARLWNRHRLALLTLLAVITLVAFLVVVGADARAEQVDNTTIGADNSTGFGLVDPWATRTTWDRIDPVVWVRDLQEGNAGDGWAFRYSEDLSNMEEAAPMCQDQDGFILENTATRRGGLTVSKDPSGRLAWECAEPGSNTSRYVQSAGSAGRPINVTPIPGGVDPRFPMMLSSRTLNNVAYSIIPEDIGLLDLTVQKHKWARPQDGYFIDNDIDPHPDGNTIHCYTDLFDGTRCFDRGGNLTGLVSLQGVDVEVHNGTVWVLHRGSDPERIHRLSTQLVTINRSTAPGARFPMDVSKTGRLLVHRNVSGGNETGNITMRWASNGTWIANSVNESAGGVADVRDLVWHPRDEGFYANADGRIHFFNSTGFVLASDAAATEQTRLPGLEEEEAPSPITNLDLAAQAMGIHPDAVGIFIGVLLMVGMGAGLGAAMRGVGEGAGIVLSGVGFIGGAAVAFLFGWFPFWVLFAVILVVGFVARNAFAGRQIGSGIRRRLPGGRNDEEGGS